MESGTAAQLAAGYKRAVIGDEEVQYLTATLLGMVDGKYHYSLTGLVRGVLDTLAEPWGAGIRFVDADSGVLFLQLQREFFGMDIYYKATSFGQPDDEVTAVAYLFDHAENQTEWQVGDLLMVANPTGPGVKVTWTERPRLGTFGVAPYHSKHFLGYKLKFTGGVTVDLPPGATSYTYEAGNSVSETLEFTSVNAITGPNAAQNIGVTPP